MGRKGGDQKPKEKNEKNIEGDRTIVYESNNMVQILIYDIPY